MTSAAVQTQTTEQLIETFSTTMRKHLREHTDGTNVNADSLLTTDYLNHYSGMVMLLEQLPATPEELIIYLLSWEPIGYEEHFVTSGFRDGDLAISAYRHAPDNIRAAFDLVIDRLQDESIKALEQVRIQAEAGNTQAMTQTCENSAPVLRDLIDEAAAIVNQQDEQQDSSQNTIDDHF